jgi:glutamate/tyrosine decarboxylase-like PLP-dependent enzyme
MTGADVVEALERGRDRVFAVVASVGATNLGIIDELPAIGAICREREIWFHVDGAYGLAILASPKLRPLATGVELSDSFIVDPHKWLFAPYDSCALLYRDPTLARAAHAQHAAYLDIYGETPDWHPSDYAAHLSRRARGFPFWFSLAVHGTDAYAEAIEAGIAIAGEIAEAVRARSYLELVAEPSLTIVVFRRCGWPRERYATWSTWLLEQGLGLVTPSIVDGETVLRMVALHPNLTRAQIDRILDTLERFEPAS